MKNREVEKLLDELIENADDALRESGLNANSCILSTKIAIEFLRTRGIPARALPVAVVGMNPEYRARLDAGRKPGAEGEVAREWINAGAWSVEVGEKVIGGPAGWNGHLVALVKNRYVLDLTAAQFRRPHKSMWIDPFWTEIERDFLSGDVPMIGEHGGSLWLYRAEPGNTSYLQANAWKFYRVSVREGRVVATRTAPRTEESAGTVYGPEIRS